MNNSDFNRQKECRHGTMLFNGNDIYVGRALDLYGEYSEGEVDLFQQIVREGDVVVELGANLGAHTVYFAKRVGPRGAVIAFEPQRLVFQTLCANMALNQITNTVCYWAAASDSSGIITVPVVDPRREFNFGGLSLGDHARGDHVPVMRADAIQLPRCRLIKVDVEGMELAAIRGASGIIERHHPILYVENDRPQNSDALIRHIHSLGYKLYWHRPFLYNPNNYFKNQHNEYPNIVSQNMIGIHSSQSTDIQGFPPVEVSPV